MGEAAVAVPDEDDLIQPHEWDSAVGDIGIEWPASAPSRTGPIPGWSVALYDEEGPVCTVAEFTLHLHASATGLVWADLTMFCTPDGKPILRGDIGSPPIYGTFRFRVTSMRMAAQQEIKPLQHAKRGTASNLRLKTPGRVAPPPGIEPGP